MQWPSVAALEKRGKKLLKFTPETGGGIIRRKEKKEEKKRKTKKRKRKE